MDRDGQISSITDFFSRAVSGTRIIEETLENLVVYVVNGKSLFEAHLEDIETVLTFVKRRHGFHGAEADDFRSFVMLRLIDDDYAVLRQFRGRSLWTTYLSAVIHRLAVDYRRAAFGQWRPSTKARKLGALAVSLEKLVSRDGLPLGEAARLLTDREPSATGDEILEIASRLRLRHPFRIETETALVNVPARETTDRLLDEEAALRIDAVLSAALETLPAEQRLALRMRFQEGLTATKIATAWKVDRRRIYYLVERALRSLRSFLEARGVTRDDALDALETNLLSFELERGDSEG